MAHLSHIKNRIQTIQKTQKITKAMRLIAMSFYSKLERQRSMLNNYRATTKTLTNILHQGQATIPAIYGAHSKAKPQPLIIVCSSAKGLCGGLNNNIIRFFERSLIATKSVKPSFITIGSKACAYLQDSSHGTIVEKIADYHLNSIDKLATTIVNHILTKKEPYTSVVIYYTHLKNFFIQTPRKEQLLPLVTTNEETGEAITVSPLKESEKYLWEQDPDRLGQALIRQHLYSEIIFALFSNLISENAARFIAMDQSTNNAHKYLETLNLAYNKSRQNIITREIAELSSSFD
ncbi:MAG: F-type H+-transporting ATPase subunit gamma [Candidatus Dependentiae bacterium]|nr:F-type H+-transporting ATPase subunit gamma [Candidatus Dependentiae bacterium]